MFIVA